MYYVPRVRARARARVRVRVRVKVRVGIRKAVSRWATYLGLGFYDRATARVRGWRRARVGRGAGYRCMWTAHESSTQPCSGSPSRAIPARSTRPRRSTSSGSPG